MRLAQSVFPRRLRFIVALVFSAAATFCARAEVTISPANPKSNEVVRIAVSKPELVRAEPYLTRTVFDGTGKIRVEMFYEPVCFATGDCPKFFQEVALGPLPSGTYAIEIAIGIKTSVTPPFNANFTVTDTLQLVVSDVTSGRDLGSLFRSPGANYSDLWFSLTEPGWGLSIAQRPSSALFAVWYVYGNDNKATWYVLQGGRWALFNVYEGNVYKTTGPPFMGPFNPASVATTLVGTGRLTFKSYDSATFEYTIEGASGRKEIVRFPF